ncbi:hypothetical protein IFT48_05705 [Pseudomonas fluorescens]|uniref:hypothetical protein n=1 Tax=Pseudomonas fluorescens TaxID=294 RepID=UPI0019053BD4|nr:hypothetical protein [Pseudomonas fluorescens]MBD8089471.1 hypothetical protein [Pseudomonas fluorescens]MBD8715900.1 hypothetical protein [Pseudomonas fluorescens]
MRYLKTIAQSKSCHGPADTVVLQFYQHHADCPDEMIYEFIGVDTTADGEVNFLQLGDLNPHAHLEALDLDIRKLGAFANSCLKLNWFNAEGQSQRSLVLYVDHFGKTKRPNAVKLDFFEISASGGKTSLIYTAAAYDGDSDGVLESFTNSDIDRSGVANKADKELTRSLCTAFLALAWYEV